MMGLFRLMQVVFISVIYDALAADPDAYLMEISLPNATPTKPDDLICTGRKLEPSDSYIIKFDPHADKTRAHHLMVYGCQMPASFKPTWECSLSENQHSEHSVCAGAEREIIFAWALNAPDRSLPPGVGFRVGGDTGINYIVVQMHYAKAFPEGDNSGITLHMTPHRPPQVAGYIILGNYGYIPPQQKEFHLETLCEFKRNYTVYPIGFRTHSHSLGVVTSGYHIRDGKWEEIGRMSPQLPQAFYEVSNPGMDIRPGDFLAARCTMNSMARTDVTFIGLKRHDEMCNFYIMYSTYEHHNIPTDYCYQDAQKVYWNNVLKDSPTDASSLEGIAGADIVRDKFNMKPRHF